MVVRVVLLFLILSASLDAQDRPQFRVTRASQPPVIDGLLNDEVWNEDPLKTGDWLSYNPLYGDKLAQRTEVRVAYDDRYLYFAFHCYDAEPDKIRTTISRRDTVFNDDWVGLSLDSSNSGQISYHLIANPSGIQMDALNSSSSGERWDADIVWDSAGKITDDGYAVEIRLPLQSIRFASGPEVKMGILFWRRISRVGESWAWPDIPPGQWVFNRHARLVFENLKQPRIIELLPSVTYNINQTRATPNNWNAANRKGELGLSAKYGITSSITLDATINPDFSQVESDAFQVQVNQRFPIFFPEKRPFFMEGMGLFNLAGNEDDGNLVSAVHTRRIVNPAFGAKLSGNSGKTTFGLLTASDDTPADVFGQPESKPGKSKLFTIGRAMYGLGGSNYVGGIVTDTEFDGRHNRVFGGDTSLRWGKGQSFGAALLASQTASRSRDGIHGIGAQASYTFNRRSVDFGVQLERFAKDFVMDTAFYNRTAITDGWAYSGLNFYPKAENSWIKRITPFVWTRHGRDQIQNGNEHYVLPGVRMHFTKQGWFRFDQGAGTEPWAGRSFDTRRRRIMGGIQLRRWLGLNGQAQNGNEIYYDPVDPFLGRSRRYSGDVNLQPNSKINQAIFYQRVAFDRISSGQRVFTVHIANLRSTYQFNRHLFARAIIQYDSSRKRVLTDLLGSYELMPGTVAHIGYGSLIEKPGRTRGYFSTTRGLFFKASYLHRF